MIENNIFFIWLGDVIPNYALFAIEAFKIANQSFNIQFIHKTIVDIEHPIVENEIDQCLLDSINTINGTYEISQYYKKYINNQIKLYGSHIRFIQLLSDVFRIQLVNSLGGIYVDCDTFPVKPFDDKILSHPFCVMSHQANSTEPHIDNYFFGMPKGSNFVPYGDFKHNMNLIGQTYHKQQSSVSYYERKMKFNKGILSVDDFPKDFPFYIEHYPSCNWKKNPSKIPFCKYDFAKWFIDLKKQNSLIRLTLAV